MWSRGSEAYRREGAIVTTETFKEAKGHKKPKNRKVPKGPPHALYRMFDNEGQLLYVGITMALHRRLVTHRRVRSWWRYVAIMEVEYLPSREAALEAERIAIIHEKPAHNMQHNGGRKPKKVPVNVEITPWYLRGGTHDPDPAPRYLISPPTPRAKATAK